MVFDHIKGGGADKLQVVSYNRLRRQVAQMQKTHNRKQLLVKADFANENSKNLG